MALTAGTRLGPYEIEGMLGGGGMGEVYKARDTRLDRTVAVKVLAPELATDAAFKARFEREARTISAVNHPHICVLHDIGEATVPAGEQRSGRPDLVTVRYLVMELLEGETLAARLTRGALPSDEALQYAAEIASALNRAHHAGRCGIVKEEHAESSGRLFFVIIIKLRKV